MSKQPSESALNAARELFCMDKDGDAVLLDEIYAKLGQGEEEYEILVRAVAEIIDSHCPLQPGRAELAAKAASVPVRIDPENPETWPPLVQGSRIKSVLCVCGVFRPGVGLGWSYGLAQWDYGDESWTGGYQNWTHWMPLPDWTAEGSVSFSQGEGNDAG